MYSHAIYNLYIHHLTHNYWENDLQSIFLDFRYTAVTKTVKAGILKNYILVEVMVNKQANKC